MENIQKEPVVNVGIIDGVDVVTGRLNGPFVVNGQAIESGAFRAAVSEEAVVLMHEAGQTIARAPRIILEGGPGVSFDLLGVTIGRLFHWERPENHRFPGNLILQTRKNGALVAINEVPVEDYLGSVISSEMNAQSPVQFLRAHSILSRSWLLATLANRRAGIRVADGGRRVGGSGRRTDSPREILKWYDDEDHDLFDVCADDHCQRYHGVTKITSGEAHHAVKDTRGAVLTYRHKVCDARYSKACGGYTELYSTAWHDVEVPYLTSVCDSRVQHAPVCSEDEATRWITSTPESYCNTTDRELLSRILPDFDTETESFFRWTVEYSQSELSEIIREKSGIDFGDVKALIPLSRGPSGRIYRLLVEGTKERVIIGKELEIRRWLSRSHLYSSAFVIESTDEYRHVPPSFTLHGAGWGHGVGLCQVGAAVMASQGFRADQILKHYFAGAEIEAIY